MSEWPGFIDPTGAEWSAFDETEHMRRGGELWTPASDTPIADALAMKRDLDLKSYEDAVSMAVDEAIGGLRDTRPYADSSWSSPNADPIGDLKAMAARMREINGLRVPLQVITTRSVLNRMPWLIEKVIIFRGWSRDVHRGRAELWWRRTVRRLRRGLAR